MSASNTIFEDDKYDFKISIIKILWMMYVLFPFRIKGIGTVQNIIYYGLSLTLVTVFLIRVIINRMDVHYLGGFIEYIFILIILTALSYIIPIIKGTGDFSYFSKYIYILGRTVIITGTMVLCVNVLEYIELIIKAIATYVIFSVILMIPPLHVFYKGILAGVSSERLYSDTYYTRFGLQGYSGFGTSYMCVFGVVLCCFMALNLLNRKKIFRKYLYLMIVCLIGSFFYSRIGLIVSVMLLYTTLFYMAVKYGRVKLFLKMTFGICLIGALIVFALYIFLNEDSFRWMFEGFLNLLKNGSFETSSSNELQSMYFMPQKETLLYGDGYYTQNGHYYMRTDSGIMRPILFWGIYIDIIYYAILIPPIRMIIRKLGNKNGQILAVLIVLSVLIYELKGEMLLDVSNLVFGIAGTIMMENVPNIKLYSRTETKE